MPGTALLKADLTPLALVSSPSHLSLTLPVLSASWQLQGGDGTEVQHEG